MRQLFLQVELQWAGIPSLANVISAKVISPVGELPYFLVATWPQILTVGETSSDESGH